MPATGKSVDVQLIDITRFGDDGLAHEHWGVFDALAMMQQLGAIPQSPPDRSIGLATRRGRAVTTEAGWRSQGTFPSTRAGKGSPSNYRPALKPGMTQRL